MFWFVGILRIVVCLRNRSDCWYFLGFWLKAHVSKSANALLKRSDCCVFVSFVGVCLKYGSV